MRIFVSWSGEVSCKIAEVLKRWIPCILQSVEVFFSPEDIEKGENWDKILSQELEECRYGIVCLTPENINAPWINFEAGAIAKSLDSKLTTLMINIKPSDIKGPLSRYQATKIEKQDFYQLIEAINKGLDNPLEEKVLKNIFDAIWDRLKEDVDATISECKKDIVEENSPNNKRDLNSAPVEEILQLLRNQNTLLNSPEKLLPLEYLDKIRADFKNKDEEFQKKITIIFHELFTYCRRILNNMRDLDKNKEEVLLEEIEFQNLIYILVRLGGALGPDFFHNAKFLERDYKRYRMFYIRRNMPNQVEMLELDETDE